MGLFSQYSKYLLVSTHLRGIPVSALRPGHYPYHREYELELSHRRRYHPLSRRLLDIRGAISIYQGTKLGHGGQCCCHRGSCCTWNGEYEEGSWALELNV